MLLEPPLLTWRLQFMCVPLKNSHTPHTAQDAGEAFFANSFGHCLWRHLGVKLCRLVLLLLLLLLRADSLFGKTRFMWPLARNSNNKSHSKWPWLLCDATDACLPLPYYLSAHFPLAFPLSPIHCPVPARSSEPTFSNLNKHFRCVKLALSIH